MEAVRHRGSVVLLPAAGPGKIILIRQFRYVIGRFSLGASGWLT
jgi:hypothetical protein